MPSGFLSEGFFLQCDASLKLDIIGVRDCVTAEKICRRLRQRGKNPGNKKAGLKVPGVFGIITSI